MLVAGSMPSPAWADVFILENGGRLEAQWLNRDEQPLTKYIIRRGRTTLLLPLAQVREAIRQSPTEAEYARRAALAGTTAADQWELAEWCRQNSLAEQRKAHLARVIELDPNHTRARGALGYYFLKGEWTTRADFQRHEGYEFYRGKWRLPQEIEILESRSRSDLAEKEWLSKLRRWRRDLDAPDKAKAAFAALMAVKDPIAVGPIDAAFSHERVRSVKAIYADMLTHIKTPAAMKALVEHALNDPDEEVFYYCIDRLAEARPPHIGDPLIAALKDNSNPRVNRAATGLARLGDKSAISPLIDALITTHTEVVNNPLAGATTTGFGTGGAFMQKGDDGPKLNVYHIQNQPVLDALTKLTSANFSFDKKAWRYWYAQEKVSLEASQPTIDVRRQ